MALKKERFDWEIHVVVNTACDVCGSNRKELRDGMCDAHTHGLKKYCGREIQLVINCGLAGIGYILNSVGEMIRDGLKLEDGVVFTSDKFQDEVRIKVFETTDVQGDPIYRLILPDPEYRFPEESSEYPYNKQYCSPYLTNAS